MRPGTGNTYLAIDIGGTKTVLALYAVDDLSFIPLEYERYASGEYEGIEPIVRRFLKPLEFCPELVVLGIAGVVSDNQAQVTNLPWVITRDSLTRLGFSAVVMINDMTALASSLPLLGKEDLLCVQEGKRCSGEVTAVLAPGTGLGEGFLYQENDSCYPRGTEGGHCDFAPADSEQLNLLSWLSEKIKKPVCYEMVCAGPAIGTLYDFYLYQGQTPADQVRDELGQAADRTPVIIAAALSGTCPVCRMAVDLFLSILGREGANLVMKVLATRGLFLGGGIFPRLAGNLSLAPFLTSFRRSGSMDELLRGIPVDVILRKDAVLLGTASFGNSFFKQFKAV